MELETFKLPEPIADLVKARNRLRSHFEKVGLKFTLDGNLVGDLGEAIASELFGITLMARNGAGIDGFAPDGRTTVQVKATGTGRGPAFRPTEIRAKHLLFFDFDFETLIGTVAYNGPEHPVIEDLLATNWLGQRLVSREKIKRLNDCVPVDGRLIQLTKKAERY